MITNTDLYLFSVARRGATVHMVCRSKERGEEARNEIISATNNQNVFLHIVDMGVPRQVMKFAKEFKGPLNVLMNNAGCMINERTMVEDNTLEANFATNTLGTYILTKALLPLIAQGSKPRIVTNIITYISNFDFIIWLLFFRIQLHETEQMVAFSVFFTFLMIFFIMTKKNFFLT
jgi:short-subunit dehydrogenase